MHPLDERIETRYLEDIDTTQTSIDGYVDFDSEDMIQSEKFSEEDRKLMEAVFSHIRGGRVVDIQNKLM